MTFIASWLITTGIVLFRLDIALDHRLHRTIMAVDAPPLYYTEADRDGDFDNVDDADPDEAFATWRAECEASRQVLAGVSSLDDYAANQRRGDAVSLRWIMVHMIEEYARHNGHADLLRQCIDGAIGE